MVDLYLSLSARSVSKLSINGFEETISIVRLPFFCDFVSWQLQAKGNCRRTHTHTHERSVSPKDNVVVALAVNGWHNRARRPTHTHTQTPIYVCIHNICIYPSWRVPKNFQMAFLSAKNSREISQFNLYCLPMPIISRAANLRNYSNCPNENLPIYVECVEVHVPETHIWFGYLLFHWK